ncbi:hypothetical protein BH11PSE14_BH11PSE14_09030 [soil metagenome]
MTTLRLTALAAAILITTGLCAPRASAQSTDGYHSIQVFPVVVESASFAQRFTFRNPDTAQALSISPRFFPGTGITPTTSLACPTFSVAADSDRVFNSLTDLCPGIPAGNVYGYVYTAEASAQNLPYAGFSRVTNPLGNGFTVEAFPAHTFTSADSTVTGLRRISASGSSPAFQTNCFIGNLNDVTPPTTPVNTQVFYTLYTSTGTQIGATTTVNLVPGTLTRLLDVFAAVGAVGDYDNVRAEFEEVGSGEPGLMTYCTVQDNSSFGADFRIGKQEEGFSSQYSSIGAQDDQVSRDSVASEDVLFSGLVTPRQFDLPGGLFSNTHVIYFRHPDRIQCELVDPNTSVRLTADDSMEMRVLDAAGNLVAGGDGVIGFAEVYLGDKTDRNFGANGRYTIEVEGTGTGLRSNMQRAYGIHCQSGSGHTVADMVRYHDAVTRF